MKTKMLGVFGLGVFGGTAAMMAALMSGCFLPFLAAARADDTTTEIVECVNNEAVFALPDSDPTTYLRVVAVKTLATPANGINAMAAPINFRGATAMVACTKGQSVAFAIR